MFQVLITFFQLLLTVMLLAVLARVIISWTMPMGGGQLVAIIYQMTEPLLAPVRQLLPPAGGFDWSPLIVTLVLGALLRVLAQL